MSSITDQARCHQHHTGIRNNTLRAQHHDANLRSRTNTHHRINSRTSNACFQQNLTAQSPSSQQLIYTRTLTPCNQHPANIRSTNHTSRCGTRCDTFTDENASDGIFRRCRRYRHEHLCSSSSINVSERESRRTKRRYLSSRNGSSRLLIAFMMWTYFAHIDAAGDANKRDSVVNISKEEQGLRLAEERLKCARHILDGIDNVYNGSHCPRIWDDLLCWGDTPANSVAVQPCPDFVDGSKPWENASRRCMEDGTWYFDEALNRTWTNFTNCTGHVAQPEKKIEFFKDHMDRVRLMYNLGYGLSLASLVVSVVIMIGFKKLHCPRNTIHLNLFFSFILRASISFTKENLLVEGLGFPGDVQWQEMEQKYVYTNDTTHWECKLFFTCFHYILGANYMWICAEALYLHTLLTLAVFSEKSGIKWYTLFGWGSPLLFVLPWVIVRAELEDVHCWNTHPTSGYFWIMRGPIVLSIFVNFIFFLNIVRLLFSKLNAVNSPEAKKYRYRKLAKSTLVLIPLFGVHYIVFAWLPKDVNNTAEIIQLYFEMFFNSVQGFFVALLFCFSNGEVRSEIRKKWQRFRLTRLNQIPKGRSNSQNHTFASYLSRPRESNASVTQFQEARDSAHTGNGSAKTKSFKHDVATKETVEVPLKRGLLGKNGRVNGTPVSEFEEQQPMIGQTSFTVTAENVSHNGGYT